MKVFADLHLVEEDKRINMIGESAMAGNVVGVILEADEPEKVARYLRKLAERYPELQHERFDDPGSPLVSFKFSRKAQPA